ELEAKREGTKGKEEFDDVWVPLFRLKAGKVAKASIVVVFPVCREEEKEDGVLRAPSEYGSEGDFGIVVLNKAWDGWVVLPRWELVVVSFGDARALPWKLNRWYKEEPILVVTNRGRKELTVNDVFYLEMMCYDNGGAGGGLKVARGSALKGKGVKESLGTVVLVVRPPKEEIED
ncbi:Rik1-associated factor 1, partial [Ancistrocladus abbreviatus]